MAERWLLQIVLLVVIYGGAMVVMDSADTSLEVRHVRGMKKRLTESSSISIQNQRAIWKKIERGKDH